MPRIEKKPSFKEEFLYWYKKPIEALKSRGDLKAKRKAPFSILIVVFLELIVFTILAFMLLFLYGLLREKVSLDELPEFFINATTVSPVGAIIIIIVIRMVLKIRRSTHKNPSKKIRR